jgi:hypothetical protein
MLTRAAVAKAHEESEGGGAGGGEVEEIDEAIMGLQVSVVMKEQEGASAGWPLGRWRLLCGS